MKKLLNKKGTIYTTIHIISAVMFVYLMPNVGIEDVGFSIYMTNHWLFAIITPIFVFLTFYMLIATRANWFNQEIIK